MPTGRLVIIGGYGTFGRQIALSLATEPRPLVIAGRSLEAAERMAAGIRAAAPGSDVSGAALDIDAPDLSMRLDELEAAVVVHTAGPFQSRGYRVAGACITAGAHYVDLADARAHVAGIASLDDAARRAGIAVVSGASSVPGLSSVVVGQLAAGLDRVDTIDIAIAPGNRAPRGQATIAAILGYTGRPFLAWENGRWQRVFGWQRLERRHFPGIGKRWLAACDVPDLALFPEHFQCRSRVSFRAGLELSVLHLAMWAMSGVARVGLVRNWARYSAPIAALARKFERYGTDTGAMQVCVSGRRADGIAVRRRWTVVARDGHGPRIPGIPAVIVARAMSRGNGPPSGARPALGLFSLAQFTAELDGLNIDQHEDESADHAATLHPAGV